MQHVAGVTRQPQANQDGGKGIGKEIKVFKDAQKSEVQNQRQGKQGAPAQHIGRIRDVGCREKIHHGGYSNESEEPPIPPRVKKIAGNQQKYVLLPVGQTPIQDHNQGQEGKVHGGIEKHVRLWGGQ